MDDSAATKQLRFASTQPLDDDTFSELVRVDWRLVCLSQHGDLDSIDLLSQALATQISSKSSRIHAVVAGVVAPFFLGSLDNRLPVLSATESFMFEKLHTVLHDICKQYPRSSASICRSLCAAFPFYATSSAHSFVCYATNLLAVSSVLDPDEERDIICLVLDRIYLLDVNTNPSDPDEELQRIKLDHSVEAVINFIESRIVGVDGIDEEQALVLYTVMSPSFIQTLCPSSKPLQSIFWMFHLASMSNNVCQRFCSDMWHVFETRSVDPVRVLGLLTSFCTRSVSVHSDHVIELLTKLANTCHQHLEAVSASVENVVIGKHSRFYAAFQSIMYMIVMRSSDFVDSKILHILQISDLVNSRMHPLAVCPDGIADAFTRTTNQLRIPLSTAGQEKSIEVNTDCAADLWISLPYHSEPLSKIKQRIGHLMRPITDPDVGMVEGMVKSLSYEKRWAEASALDFAF